MAKKIQPRFIKNLGRVHETDATYLPQNSLTHAGNPLIEALPPRLSEDLWIKRLTKRPDYSVDYRAYSDVDRMHEMENIKRFYQPLDIPLRLACDFDIMLRSGYVDRSPISPTYRRELLQKRDDFDAEQAAMDEYDDDGVTTSGITIMGLSGMGKTRALNRILARYPQRINHSYYDGQHLTFAQIGWLKFDCPPRGTLNELVVSFLYMLDRTLGDTNYLANTLRSKSTPAGLIANMISLATEHYLGALILDEVGNLVGAKEGRVLLNYLIKFSNDFKIPIILVGTPKAQHILTKSFSQMRRGYGYDEYNKWLQMKKESDDWDVFVTALWQYQYLREFTELTSGLKNRLHDISGGITDLAVKMFIASQKRAIRNKMEKLTVGLLRDVGREEFGWAAQAVAALKLGTPQALQTYEDLYYKHASEAQRPNPEPGISSETPSEASLSNQPSTSSSNPPNKRTSAPRKSQAKKGEKSRAGLLVDLVVEGRANSKTAYQSLLEAGYIASATEYLEV
jgi:hypothetical protein